MKKILFVCLGNICRSPAAEAVMNHLVSERGVANQIQCDSAGTYGAHAGELSDSRMIKHALTRNITITSRSRKILPEDLEQFDLIIGMDNSNIQNSKRLDPTGEFHHKIYAMTEFCRTIKADEVPDPYYGGSDGFEFVLDILEDACVNLLEKILDGDI